MERWKRSLAGIVLCITVSVPAGADEDDIADGEFLDFLEYLGSQDDSSDEWAEFFDSLPDPDDDAATDNAEEQGHAETP